MRRYSKYFFLLLTCIFNCCSSKHNNVRISLDRSWKFKTGDQMVYAGQYNDTLWRSVHLSDSWDHLIPGKYSGFAWYRVSIFIPSSWKKALNNKDSLIIYLGHIADCDQTFINGFIIGENGINVAEAHVDSAFTDKMTSVKRKYSLAVKDHRIVWDKENLIAIRIFVNDKRSSFTDNPYIGIAAVSDSISFNSNEFYQPDRFDKLDTNLIITNATSTAINGNISIHCMNQVTHLNIFKTHISIVLNPKSNKKIPVSIPYSEDPVKVYLTYRDNELEITNADSLTLPFILNR
jgi:alpha-galactosidase